MHLTYQRRWCVCNKRKQLCPQITPGFGVTETCWCPPNLVGGFCVALMALGAYNRWASTEEAFVATQGNESRSLLNWGYSQLLRSDFERSTSESRHGVADQWFIWKAAGITHIHDVFWDLLILLRSTSYCQHQLFKIFQDELSEILLGADAWTVNLALGIRSCNVNYSRGMI